jgi:hypothetical protein
MISEIGASRKGPMASPNSQMVTSSTLADLSLLPSLRSETMLLVIGTTDMQVKVLWPSILWLGLHSG